MKKTITRILIFLGIAVLQIGLVYLVARLFILSPSSADSEESVKPPTTGTEKPEPETSVPLDSVYIDTVPTDLKEGYVFNLDDIVVNPANTRGKRFLSMSLAIYLHGKKEDTQNNVEEYVVRDAINSLVSRKTSEWLSDVDNREILREEIRLLAKKIFKGSGNPIVFITKYVMQ